MSIQFSGRKLVKDDLEAFKIPAPRQTSQNRTDGQLTVLYNDAESGGADHFTAFKTILELKESEKVAYDRAIHIFEKSDTEYADKLKKAKSEVMAKTQGAISQLFDLDNAEVETQEQLDALQNEVVEFATEKADPFLNRFRTSFAPLKK